jgi:hypothetical protein
MQSLPIPLEYQLQVGLRQVVKPDIIGPTVTNINCFKY